MLPASVDCDSCDGDGKVCRDCGRVDSACDCNPASFIDCPACGGCGAFCLACDEPFGICRCGDELEDGDE